MLSVLLGQPDATSYDLVRATWQSQLTGDFEKAWRKVVHDGIIPATAAAPVKPNWVSQPGEWTRTLLPPPPERPAGAIDVAFRPASSLYDGRFANNGWLQEVPKHMTRVTWDNPALIAPATAEKLGLDVGAMVEVTLAGRTLQVPVWIQPGHAADAITLALGFGRTRAGKVGNEVGFNTYLLRTSAAPWSATDASLVSLGRHYKLACTQDHHSMHGRNLVRVGTLEQFRADPEFAHTEDMRSKSMYPGFKYEGHAWGMTVDIGACVGCNACIIACQAENNIPVVGKIRCRAAAMQWIRVDCYFEATSTIPRPCCSRCSPAPRAGTVRRRLPGQRDGARRRRHQRHGYNRCVGTRYCRTTARTRCGASISRCTRIRSRMHKMVFNLDVTPQPRRHGSARTASSASTSCASSRSVRTA